MHTPHWPKDPKRYRWFIDGHNAIFAHPALEVLQTGEEQGEARRRLESMLDRFAATHGLQVTVVYDGNRTTQNPDAGVHGRVVSQYSLRPNEDADDRIVLLASESVRSGLKVVVVTSDRALGERLPSGVDRVEPVELFRRLQTVADRQKDESPPGDYSDIEAHFLALEPVKPVPSRKRTTSPPRSRPPASRPGSPASRRPPSPARRPEPPPATPPNLDTGALAKKKARGRRKQERRLARGRKRKRRRRGR